MDYINAILWAFATILLVSCGFYYSFKLKFPQFHFRKILRSLQKEDTENTNISPFKTLTLALAARIGVGSLAGISLGIFNGGVGVVFWIWLSSLITLPNSFVESILAVKYRVFENKFYKGGPAYYINNGLKYHRLALVYALIITLCYLGGFLAIQSNTIASSINAYLNVPVVITGIIVSFFSYLIISRGLKRIVSFTSVLVPIMGIAYFIVALIIIFMNIENIPNIFLSIIREAFNFKALGWGIISSIIIGVQRGIFSSEAGIGTGAVASGTSDTKYPLKQGYLQMLGVYFTSFIICTSTALIVLTSNIDLQSYQNVNGIEITLQALKYHLGNIGTVVLLLAILSFAFSTIVSGYYYGESNLSFIDKKMNKKKLFLLNIVVAMILFLGAILKPTNLWNIVDIGVAILAIINSIAMLLLNRSVKMEYNKERSR